MARPLRIEYPGAIYHITSRGNARGKIYKDDNDREAFLEILGSVIKRYNYLCHAYCLMDNHYHLIIETPEPNLSRGMRQLNGVYTQAYNRRHRKAGHIFQGRYKSILIEKENYLLELCRYIILNPIRAGITKKPEQWEWSSYLATIGKTKTPAYLTTDWILGQFGSKRSKAERQYAEFVKSGISKGKPWDDLEGQILLGGDEFITKFKELLADKKEIKEIPRRQRYVGRPELAKLFKDTRDANRKKDTIYQAHVRYGYTLKEIADYLNIHYTTVSKIVKKVEGRS
ncbi:MAG: transposase [Nitrospirae bacterium]|nr:transposase [Nitrospirota bacterium]